MYAICENCGRKAHLGDRVRTYRITSPLAEFDLRLCYRCFEKQARKDREHITIQDKVHVSPTT
jgi:hypothetical protein